MNKFCLLGSLAISALALSITSSQACGWDGCFFAPVSGGNTPQILKDTEKAVVETAKANIETSVEMVKSFSKGDIQGVYDKVGRLVVQGACIGCKDAIKAVGGDAAVNTVEQMVTIGFIILTRTSSMFVTYDAVAKKALVSPRSKPAQPISNTGNTKIVKRSKQTFDSSAAVCIVSNGKIISVGYKEIPKLKNVQSGVEIDSLHADLRSGDLVNITAPLCPAENRPKNKQVSLAKVQLSFYSDEITKRSGQDIVYQMHGQIPKNK